MNRAFSARRGCRVNVPWGVVPGYVDFASVAVPKFVNAELAPAADVIRHGRLPHAK
jgi:hypothetical protein